MCNRYGYQAPIQRLIDEFSQVRLPIVFPEARIPNLEPRAQIRPTDPAPILRPLDPANPEGGLELVERRWWLVPWFHKGPAKAWKALCTNARAESLATTAAFKDPFRRRRCLAPATCFYEWTGEKGKKQMWRFARPDGGVFCFPGVWEKARTADGPIESFAIVTCAPGPDCAPYHDRQPVILELKDWGLWLDLDADPTPLLQPGVAGSLLVEPTVDEPVA